MWAQIGSKRIKNKNNLNTKAARLILSNWEKLVYVFVKRSFIFKIKRSADFENKTSEK